MRKPSCNQCRRWQTEYFDQMSSKCHGCCWLVGWYLCTSIAVSSRIVSCWIDLSSAWIVWPSSKTSKVSSYILPKRQMSNTALTRCLISRHVVASSVFIGNFLFLALTPPKQTRTFPPVLLNLLEITPNFFWLYKPCCTL